ncbi:glycosyltransferase family 4 protein [Rossellomorea vietnamensis]|uniref:Glycosyltransferase family 4 protein n=1 Tax=Rossellomorea vietnamensis TaxID=218284 RepID=A0A5D4NTU1_9BACI|nr:glycosyltransferase family 1 protein [Rossellomorea vietnamensis]TYS17743.1 glycosyltransferase family 4 protein [Rossellomorea vietnamensis]
MKKLYINGRFLTQKVTGVQRVAEEIIKDIDRYLISGAVENQFEFTILVPKNSLKDLKLKKVKVKEIGVLQGHLWEQLLLPLYTIGRPLINFCNTGPIFKRKQTVFIHDAAVFMKPEGFSKIFVIWYKLLFRLLSLCSNQIITVSNFSKEELQKNILSIRNEIEVIKLGVDHIENIQSDNGILERFNLKKDGFLLAVGSLHPNKNFEVLLSSFDQMKEFEGDVVIAGGIDKKVISKEISEFGGKIKHVGYVSDEELCSLYSNAKVFIFPSIYEGFGLPPVEAMKLGCPVIASNAASIPEICQDGAIYFDPKNSAELIEKIHLVYDNKFDILDLTFKGAEIAEEYKWRKTVEELFGVLKKNN